MSRSPAERPRGIPKGAPMPASASSPVPGGIVARLRAAGCVFAEDEARLLVSSARTPADLAAMVDRRARGLPIEQVLGWAEFCGLRIAVDPGVFVPRRRTEFLVRQAAVADRQTAADHQPAADTGSPSTPRPSTPRHSTPRHSTPGRRAAPDSGPPDAGAAGERPPVIVDLCCGSGAVGAALAAALGGAELHAADLDPAAVACALRNVAAAGGRVYRGDLYDPLPRSLRGRVDLLVANVPYIPTDAIALLPPEARVHEPRLALDGGADGLDVVRRVAAGARHWLAPRGHLLVETSERQAPGAVAAFAAFGLVPRVASSDEVSATVVIGTPRLAPAGGASALDQDHGPRAR